MLGEVISTARSIEQERTTVGVALKVAEETGELAQAVLKRMGYEEIVSEVADVIIAVTDAGYQASLDDGLQGKYEADLMIAISNKLNKWCQVYGK